MTKQEFETGAIVYLKIGSPPLAVSSLKRDDGLVSVEWFDGPTVHEHVFDAENLFLESAEQRHMRMQRAGKMLMSSDGVMAEFDEYRGMDYEQASREAQRLIGAKGWYQSWERLCHLRRIMEFMRDVQKVA